MAVTVVRYAPEPGAIVRRREGGELVVEAIPADEVGRWVAERDGDDRRYGVEVVEVGLPNPFLERGIALVDTPGVGGLNAAHAAATLAFLPSADALVFVTDASTELSAPELDFLASAMRAGPPILIAVTKVDIYPEWRRIVAIDEGRLTAMGLADPPFPLSSVLRAHGLATGDPTLEAESGYPRFAAALAEDVVGRARGGVAGDAPSPRSCPPSTSCASRRRPRPRRSTTRPRPPRLTTDLREVRGRLATLAAADASWSVRLEDEFAAPAHPDRVRVPGPDARAPARAPGRDRADRPGPRLARGQPADPGRHGGRGPGRVPRGDRWRGRDPGDDRRAPRRRDARARRASARRSRSTWPRCGRAARPSRAAPGPAWWPASACSAGRASGSRCWACSARCSGRRWSGRPPSGSRPCSVARRSSASGGASWPTGASRRGRSSATFLEEVRFEADGRLASLLDDVQRQMRARFADRIHELRRTFAETAEALEQAAAQADESGRARRPELAAELAEIDALRARAADPPMLAG